MADMAYKRIKDLHGVDFVPHSYYHSKFNNTFSMEAHSHPYVELMYVRSGEVSVEIYTTSANQKQKNKSLTLSEKQFILLDAGTTHSLVVKSAEPAVISNVEWAMLPKRANHSEESELISLDVRTFFERFEGLERFAYSPNGYAVALDSGNLEHCLIYYINMILEGENSLTNQCAIQARFVQVLTELAKCLEPSNLGLGIIYIKRAQDFIKNHFNRTLTVDEIAQYAGVNKTYLQRLFNSYTGMSVLQSLNNFRISKCKRILIETNLTIDEICSHVGFNNRQQLIYEFKIQTGMTPTQYRNEFLNKNFRHTPQSAEYVSLDINGNPIV